MAFKLFLSLSAVVLPIVPSMADIIIKFLNPHSGRVYSTLRHDQWALTTTGSIFNISLEDQFDRPAQIVGCWTSEQVAALMDVELADAASLTDMFVCIETSKTAEAFKRFGAQPTSHLVPALVVPKPRQALGGKTMRVVQSSEILSPQHCGICHGSGANYSMCHEPSEQIQVFQVRVRVHQHDPGHADCLTCGGDESDLESLYVVCHLSQDVLCHLLNVGDIIFTFDVDKRPSPNGNLRGSLNSTHSSKSGH